MITTQVLIIVSQKSPSGLLVGIAGRVFFIIKFFDIKRSTELDHALRTWESDFFPIDFDFLMPKITEENVAVYPLPEVFERQDFSSSLLLNSWDNIVLLSGLFILCVILRLSKRVVKERKKIFPTVEMFNTAVQGYLFIQLYATFGDMFCFILLEFSVLELGNWSSNLSFTIGLIFLMIIIACFTFHFFLIYKYQHIKKKLGKMSNNEELLKFENDHKAFQFLFREFHNDSLSQQFFLIFLSVRDITFSFIVTVLYRATAVQVIFFLLLSLIGLVYLVAKRPFREKSDQLLQLIYEFIILIVAIVELIGYSLGDENNPDTPSRIRLGKLLFILNGLFIIISFLFMIVKLLLELREAYLEYRQKLKQRRIIVPQEPSAPNSPQNLIVSDIAQLKDFEVSRLEDEGLVSFKSFKRDLLNDHDNENNIQSDSNKDSSSTKLISRENHSRVSPSQIENVDQGSQILFGTVLPSTQVQDEKS